MLEGAELAMGVGNKAGGQLGSISAELKYLH